MTTDLIITIDEDNVVYIEMTVDNDDTMLLTRMSPDTVEIRDMRERKPRKQKWWRW